MKKQNLFVILGFILIIAVAFIVMGCNMDEDKNNEGIVLENNIEETKAPVKDQEKEEPVKEETAKQPIEEKTEPLFDETKDVIIENSLFIGDSRTVGLLDYAKISGADFFANVGMTVYNIYDKKVSVPGVGKVTIEQLLVNKNYDKIYIMLGINEAGYNIDNTINKYSELVSYVSNKQGNAKILILANLHVTKERSSRDKIINNQRIDELNLGISKLSDNKNIFYIDTNKIFDDDEGNLSSEKSGDSTHLYAKYYKEWGRFIANQTLKLFKEV